jgi:serine phosphatase RsbU (regulator of sigma subunit)
MSNQVGKLVHSVIDGVCIQALHQPVGELGGDLFEILHPAPGRLRVVIGDICGRGAQAARWVEQVRPVVRQAVGSTAGLVKVMETINAEVHQTLPDDVFVTLALLQIDVRDRTLRSVNAGHVPTLVRRGRESPVIFGHASGPPLGMLHSARYSLSSMPVDTGDIFVLMTDGVLEAIEPDLIGMTNLMNLLAQGGELREIGHGIWNKALSSARRPDDFTWIGIQILATQAEKHETASGASLDEYAYLDQVVS